MLIEMRDVLDRLLTPEKTLNPLLFDEQNRMLADVQRILLTQANYIFALIISEIKGLKFTGAYLTGSQASYFYHEKSDINLRIGVKNENCPELAEDSKFLSQFLQFYFFGHLHNQNFRLGDKKVNIQFNSGAPEKLPLGLYSLLQNKWIIAPQQNITENLNADAAYKAYEQKYNEIETYLLSLDNSGELPTENGIKKLDELYNSLIANSNNSITDFIIFKMLNYRGMINNITDIKNHALKDFLSIDYPAK